MSTASLPHTPEEPASPTESDDGEDLGPPQIATFLQHISAVTRHSERVAEEHVYSRRWDDDEEARQTRLLLVNPTTSVVRPADACPIDVETVDEPINLTDQDERSSLAAMMEFQEHSALASREVPDDAIDSIDQSMLSTAQRRLLRRVLSALDGYRLARKAVVGQRGAAFVARVQCDRCSARVRRALAASGWTRSLCAWMHGLLLTKLGKETLPLYLEVVQTLSSKVPGLVERLTAGGGTRHGALSTEALTPLLRRPWDPAATIIAQHRLTRLPNSPLLVVVPSSPCHSSSSSSGGGARRLLWQRQLASLGRVVNIDVFDGQAPSRGISVGESLAHILAMCRQQLSELRRPGRPLVLLAWGAASLVAAHLALVEPVSALVALGFPCWSAAGQRGVGDDPLLECRAPTLLVVGETATDAAPQELERLRRRGRSETSLVVVGGADRRLLVNPQKRARQGLTQNLVDRAIMEEIGQFLTRILTQQLDGARPVFARPPSPPPQRTTDDLTRNSVREKRRRVNGHAAGRPRVPRQQLRPGDPTRPPRTSKKVLGKASPVTVSAPTAGPGAGPVAAAPLPTVEPAAAPEPPVEPRSSRAASPAAADDSPAPTPAPTFTALPGRTVQTAAAAAASPLKIATTPTYRLQSPVGAVHESGLIAITPQTLPTRHLYGPARPHPAEARGRLKVSQKRPPTSAGPSSAKPGRGRGSRSRAPRYGVAGPELRPGLARLGQVREFSTSQMGSSRFLTPTVSTGRHFPAPAAAAAAPGPERASQQQLVYVRPPAAGTARPRSVLVGRGRGHRTVTYVPAGQQSRPTPLPDDP